MWTSVQWVSSFKTLHKTIALVLKRGGLRASIWELKNIFCTLDKSTLECHMLLCRNQKRKLGLEFLICVTLGMNFNSASVSESGERDFIISPWYYRNKRELWSVRLRSECSIGRVLNPLGTETKSILTVEVRSIQLRNDTKTYLV